MAIKRDDRYPGRWSPANADYPLGGPKNRTTPSAKDGSYFEKDWIADYEAFFGKLLSDAGITPNNTSDTAQLSQFHEAFIAALSVENRLKSNQNFNVEGADGHISATPQTFTVGQEFAKGRFVAGSDLVNATYTGGLINADSGSYYVEYEGDFTSDFYGIKLADDSIVQAGVTISLATGNTRITVDMSTAPAHKFAGLSENVGVWPNVNDIDSSATSGGEAAKRIENNNGAAAFDLSGVLWQTDDVANASATVGGSGWFQVGLGVNQTYHDETSNRLSGVEYRNTRDRTIFIAISLETDLNNHEFKLTIDGKKVINSKNAPSGQSMNTRSAMYPIPKNSTYEYYSSGTLANFTFFELY